MNIKITYNWLLEYLETNSSPFEIQKYLSLSGPSIERVEKIEDDYVFDIEIISNRIDTASVYGIAQESQAILPLYEKKAKLKTNIFEKHNFSKIKINQEKYFINPKIEENDLCSRFAAIVLDDIKIGPSPKFIQERLTASGIKVINNVVDISNYLMLSFGQPTHVFDFDRITKNNIALMKMRTSKKGEKITTLDKLTVVLPGGDIVIEGVNGDLIDLCGVMGGFNSCITEKTKRVILFVQTYNKQKIRKTTMTTGVRTVAATYFEKGLDEERVEPTLCFGVELLEKYAQAVPSSKIYDIYPKKYQEKTVTADLDFFNKIIGIEVEKKTIASILKNLGFKTEIKKNKIISKVPSYRKYDISIPEDLIEEVARVYGYHKITENLPPAVYITQPPEFEKLFKIISKIKTFLKHLGLNEVINYSMISVEMIENWSLKPENHLKLKNTISNEIEYMRQTLMPSIYKNLVENKGKKEILKFFEIAKVYLPKKNELPDEIYRLAVGVNTDYFDLKGIFESLFIELNINQEYIEKVNFVEKDEYFFGEIDLIGLIEKSQILPKYQPINPYSIIKLDKTFELSEQLTYKEIVKKAKKSKLLKKIEIVSLFKNKLTLRFYFSSSQKNITEDEAKEELKLI